MRNLDLLLRGVQTRRFHTVPTIQTETVGHHSALVAGMLFLAYPDCSRNVLVHATFHDLAECETGDIPSPSKRAFVDRAALNQAEYRILQASNLNLPVLTEVEERQLKVADILAGLATCLHERQLGNTLVKTAWQNFASYYVELPNLGNDPSAEANEVFCALQERWLNL